MRGREGSRMGTMGEVFFFGWQKHALRTPIVETLSICRIQHGNVKGILLAWNTMG